MKLKNRFSKRVFVVRALLIGFAMMLPFFSFAADIEATLPTSDSTSGFVVKSSGGSTLFKVAGDGSLTLATSISASNVSTGARHTQTITSTAKTSAYSITSNDGVILANPSAGAFTITLPSATDSVGRTYSVVLSGGGNELTLDGNSSETIDGALTTSLSSTGSALTVISDGSNWHSLSMATTGNSSGYSRTAIVAGSGGDYSTPNDAVSNIATWCGTPSSSNPCTIFIASGYYTLTATLDLSSNSYVSVVGAGQKATFLDMPDDTVLKPAGEGEVRDLTLVGSGTTNTKYGLELSSTAVLLNDVTVNMTSTGSNTYGIHVSGTAAVTANSVTVNTVGGSAYGVNNEASGNSTWNNLNVMTSGGSAWAYYENNASGLLTIKNSTIATTDTVANAVYSNNRSTGYVTLRNSVFRANGGAGVYANNSSNATYYMDNLDIDVGGGAAISNNSNVVFEVRNSKLKASGGTGILAASNQATIRVAETQIDAGTNITENFPAASTTCFDIYDASFAAITAGCDTNNN